MDVLEGKKIVLGITGSIAAYKSAILTRFLIKAGCDVKVVMTKDATYFIPALTLSTLSKNEVVHSMASNELWNNHVELGLWADAMVIAPCTANTLSKMANGQADNMLIASYLSAKCPVFVAPAMDLDMWKHPSTSANLEKLKSYGNFIIPVEYGELASGLTGEGRMSEPENIVEFLAGHFSKKKDLTGKYILITAGPTYESIDPVRYIGNHSSGKMGVAIALECAERGAFVHLILGPSSIYPDHPNVKITHVISAEEMYQASIQAYQATDAVILAAAVSDYTPSFKSEQKIKKNGGMMAIDLKRTKDIAAELGKLKHSEQKNIGFALETENELENARLKLDKKNFDFIVLNSLNQKGAGFRHDTNKITIIHKNKEIHHYQLKSKTKVAEDIVNELVQLLD